MHLSDPYFLISSFCALQSSASPTSPLNLPNLPSDGPYFLGASNISGSTGLAAYPYETRPANMETYIDDYLFKIGSKIPDSGQGDPKEISKALSAISNWFPSQAKPDGSYPAKIRYEGVVDQVKYTFTAEEYRGSLTAENVRYSQCHHFPGFCYPLP